MNEENKKDVNKGEGAPGEESDSKEPASKGSEAVKNAEEIKKQADELLGPIHKVEVPRFNELNEKAKLWDKYEPLIGKVMAKISEKDEFADEILGNKKGDPIEDRLSRLEEERKAEERILFREALEESLSQWPDFKKSWDSVRPIAESLRKSGVSYKDAFRRGYLAINPEAAQAEAERIAQDQANRLGETRSPGGRAPQPANMKSERKLKPGEQRAARVNNMTDEQYAATLDRLAPMLRARGFYDDKLEVPLE